jgi:hypothetical protein
VGGFALTTIVVAGAEDGPINMHFFTWLTWDYILLGLGSRIYIYFEFVDGIFFHKKADYFAIAVKRTTKWLPNSSTYSQGGGKVTSSRFFPLDL